MRTAVTAAVTHKGEIKILSLPDFPGSKGGVPVHEQFEAFRKLKYNTSHPEYALVTYQESDGEMLTYRFRSPKAQKEYDDLRAKEKADAQAESKPATKTESKAAEPVSAQ